MATTTRANLRKALSQAIGDYNTFSTSADGNDAKTSLVSGTLKNYPGGTDDGAFEEQYFLSTSGANEGESRRCLLYISDATDGPTVILQSALSSQSASSDTFELHRYDPELKHTSINRALAELFPTVYLPLRDETLIVDNTLSNSDFEDWTSGSADNWTEVNSPTLTQETSRIFHGSSSATLTGPSGSVGQLTQAPDININEIAGKTAQFKCRVWTNGASQARLIIDWDGTNTEAGDYHEGDSEWRLLSVDSAVPTTATQVKFICEVAAETTAYFDTSWAAVDPLYRLTVPSTFVRGPFRVYQQHSENLTDGPYYPLLPGESPTRGRILRLEGMGILSRPSTESGTAEIGEPQLNLVTAYSAMILFQQLWTRSASEQRENLGQNISMWQGEVARLSQQPGIRMRTLGAHRGRNTWHIEEDSSGRYLQFDSSRASASSFSS